MAATAEQAVDPNMKLVQDIKAGIDKVRLIDPLWCNEYEDKDPMIADRADVEQLLETAPNDWAYGLIQGIMLIRLELSSITGAEF